MKKGQRVKIINTNSIWDDKEGVLEEINGEKCTVFVDFIPEQNKRVRQDFNLENVESLDSFNEALKDTVSGLIGELEKDFKNGYGLFRAKDGSKFQVDLDDLEEIEDITIHEFNYKDEYASKFEEDLEGIEKSGNGDEYEWFFEDNGSLDYLKNQGIQESIRAGKVVQETISGNNKFKNPNNITVYTLKKGKGSSNQFRAYFYRDGNTFVFVRGHIKKGYENGPKEYKCIQDTIDYANSHISVDKTK